MPSVDSEGKPSVSNQMFPTPFADNVPAPVAKIVPPVASWHDAGSEMVCTMAVPAKAIS